MSSSKFPSTSSLLNTCNNQPENHQQHTINLRKSTNQNHQQCLCDDCPTQHTINQGNHHLGKLIHPLGIRQVQFFSNQFHMFHDFSNTYGTCWQQFRLCHSLLHSKQPELSSSSCLKRELLVVLQHADWYCPDFVSVQIFSHSLSSKLRTLPHFFALMPLQTCTYGLKGYAHKQHGKK